MDKKNSKSKFFVLIAIFLVVIFVGIKATQNVGRSTAEKSYDKSTSYLRRYLKSIKVSNAQPVKSNVALGKSSVKDELPDISQYDLKIQGSGDINIEIFSSPEKSGDGSDGYLIEIAQKFKIAPNRAASLLDIFSCFVQGMIPYGAQLLMAASLSGVSPVHIMRYLYYPYLLGIGALLAIQFSLPRKYARGLENAEETNRI